MNFSFYFIKHKTTDKMLETIVYIIFVFFIQVEVSGPEEAAPPSQPDPASDQPVVKTPV